MTTVDDDTPRVTRTLPRQARALRTRQRLIEAGRYAFETFGVEGASLTDDILRPAGVSVGSFYHQFADKTELLLAVISDGVEARLGLVVDEGLSIEHAELDDVIRAGVGRFFESLDSDHHAWRLQLAEQNNPDPRVRELVGAGRQRWVAQISRALERLVADDDDLLSAATMLVTLATGTANVYLARPVEGQGLDRTAMVNATTCFAIAGVRAVLGAGHDRQRQATETTRATSRHTRGPR